VSKRFSLDKVKAANKDVDDAYVLAHVNPVDREMASMLKQVMSQLAGGKAIFPVSRILDLGSGSGYVAQNLQLIGAASQIVGVDISIRQLVAAAQRTEARNATQYAQADADFLPFADETFDIVVANSFLHHMPNDLSTLLDIRRVLKSRGMFFLLHEPSEVGNKIARKLLSPYYFFITLASLLKRRFVNRPIAERRGNTGLTDVRTYTSESLVSVASDAGFRQVLLSSEGLIVTVILRPTNKILLRLRGRQLAGTEQRFLKLLFGWVDTLLSLFLPDDWFTSLKVFAVK